MRHVDNVNNSIGLSRDLRALGERLDIPLLSWTSVQRYGQRFPDAALERYLPGARSIVVFASPMLNGVVDTLLLGGPPFIERWRRELSWAGLRPLLGAPSYLLKQLVKGATSAYNHRYHLQEHLDWLNLENDRRAYLLARLLESRGERALVVDPCKRHYFPLKGFLSLKHAAAAAGIGSIGRHRQLITKRFGPRVWLGGLLTTAALPEPETNRVPSPCRRCTVCVDNCPPAQKAGGFSFPPHACTLCSTCLAVCPAPRSG